MPYETNAIIKSAEIIYNADAILVAAGAGMGADSGLATFRGQDGFWKNYPALKQAGINFQDIANPLSFSEHPELAWGFYGHRLNHYRQTKPHHGFQILREWGNKKTNGIAVFTSNVDGQFQKAGFAPDLIHECHGSIHYLQCITPCCQAIWPATDFNPIVSESTCLLLNELPRCPSCGAIARPNIMMFDDEAWLDNQEQQQSKNLKQWLSFTKNLVIIEIGAGITLPSVRYFSHKVCEKHNGTIIRINMDENAVLPSNKKCIALHVSAIDGLTAISKALINQ